MYLLLLTTMARGIQRGCIGFERKEAISHFAVTRNVRVLVYFSRPFVIPVPYQPQGTNFTSSLY